ncbi:porin family protein [Flavobacterium wongokense]|uniref:porin family protein n=1 Tax=Flavobacterium wongokense TaxID=2910674 RepID=UPI001F47DA41|nr:porin family protein [Flavobacterium sp. WG47]MCF6131008.1 porin family protein [Flavobacterium sp. WG47]
MIKKVIVSICLLFSLAIFAQEGTSSPYSFYGIGDIKFKGTIENRSMGSISVLPDSIHLNIQNPAHFASLKLTSFTIGGTYANTKSVTESQEAKARRTSLDYLAFGIPVGKKLGIAFGLVPYSSLGYKIGKIKHDIVGTDTIRSIYSQYSGIGGVNRVFVGFGYKLTKNLNFGADIQYNFGTIETKNLKFQNDLQYGSREINTSDLRGVNFDFGLAYQTKTSTKHTFFSSIAYTPQSELTLGNSREIQLIQFLSSSAIQTIESQDVPVADTKIKLPSKLTIGAGFGEIKKWSVGGEVSFIKNSVMSNRFDDIDEAGRTSFENSIRYSIGGFYIPNYNSYSNYYKRVVYRGGLRYENTGLVILDKSINDFAANVGLGLPLGGIFSNINVGLEIGKRGTKYYNLVEENYVNISVGLSLSDRWFVKRKFD